MLGEFWLCAVHRPSFFCEEGEKGCVGLWGGTGRTGVSQGVQGSQELSLGCWPRSRPNSLDMGLEFCCPSSAAIFLVRLQMRCFG